MQGFIPLCGRSAGAAPVRRRRSCRLTQVARPPNPLAFFLTDRSSVVPPRTRARNEKRETRRTPLIRRVSIDAQLRDDTRKIDELMYQWLRVEDTLVTLRLRCEQDRNETDGWCVCFFFFLLFLTVDRTDRWIARYDREEMARCSYDARC